MLRCVVICAARWPQQWSFEEKGAGDGERGAKERRYKSHGKKAARIDAKCVN